MKRAAVISSIFMMLTACSILQTLTNVSRLKFKLESVDNYRVLDIPVDSKSKFTDFSAPDVLKLSSSLASGKLPVSFNLNISADNPNDGSDGYPATEVTIKEFPWDLYINDKKTISGNINEPINVPGVGENKIIELNIKMDLLDFFENNGLKEIVNIALKLGGQKGGASNIKLVATPVLGTTFGDIKYPEPVTIVDYTYN